MKVKTIREGVICYVTKLNRSNTDLPKALLDVKGTVSMHTVAVLFF